jgi:ribose transport system substrate-binding protein
VFVNFWRQQMVRSIEAEAKSGAEAPYIASLKIESANGGVVQQIAQIQDLINSGANAILIDAQSPTALNNVIAQAHQRHVIVVAFDNVVTSPYAYNVSLNHTAWGTLGAEWLAKTLHYKGNVVLIDGLAGTTANTLRHNAAMAVFKKYPGIHVLASVAGNWDEATEQNDMSNLLASYSDINGVWADGGGWGVLRAYTQAHRPFVPVAGEDSNGFRILMHRYARQVPTFSVGNPPAIGAVALDVAINLLNGKSEPHTLLVTPPTVSSSGSMAGEYFPNLPIDFEATWTIKGLHYTLKQLLSQPG